MKIDGKPEWIKPERFGVLTVEDLGGDLGEALRSFGINVDQQKTTHTVNTTLLKMVEQITGVTK